MRFQKDYSLCKNKAQSKQTVNAIKTKRWYKSFGCEKKNKVAICTQKG